MLPCWEYLADNESVELLYPVFVLQEPLHMILVIFTLVFLIRHKRLSNIFIPVPIFSMVAPIARPVTLYSPVVSDLDQPHHAVLLWELNSYFKKVTSQFPIIP